MRRVRTARMARFHRLLQITGNTHILDVGGTPARKDARHRRDLFDSCRQTYLGRYTSDYAGAFVCTEDVTKGTMSVPPYILSTLRKRGESGATVFIATHPSSRPVQIPGLE